MTNAKALRECLGRLTERDRDFAESMLYQWERRGLTGQQMFYVNKLIARANGEKPETKPVGDMSGVIALFDKAREKLRYPKIRLALPDLSPVVISVAGERSREPGSLNVTDGGRFGANVWYGRVSPDGQFAPGRKPDEETMTSVTALLVALSADPAGTAAKYGALTGSCSFCGLPLTDPRSTEVGYGPVCAKNYSLPWGKAA